MRKRRPAFAAIAAALLALAPCPALAQALSTTDYSATLGTAAQQCVPPNGARRTLYIENAGTTNSIAYCVAAPNGTCTPALNAAGSSTLAPSVSAFWQSGSAPIGAVYCIAGGSSSPVTIRSAQ